jgi:protein-L-isoaspartate(D-aspartate) O-methyltransferase
MKLVMTVRRSTRSAALVLIALLGCSRETARPAPETPPAPAPVEAPAPQISRDPAEARRLRNLLVDQLKAEGWVHSDRVLAAMRVVPRHLFVPTSTMQQAYEDRALPIGHAQTISQPAVVGVMTQALQMTGKERVLEIGTGSGYQAAVLSVLCREVYTIEIVPALGEEARERLGALGYTNVHVKIGDGYAGWKEFAPFDAVVVTAAPPEVPKALFDQLADGGILVAPIGPSPGVQRLTRFQKVGIAWTKVDLGPVLFVPMIKGGS